MHFPWWMDYHYCFVHRTPTPVPKKQVPLEPSNRPSVPIIQKIQKKNQPQAPEVKNAVCPLSNSCFSLDFLRKCSVLSRVQINERSERW